jgi:fructokinase
MKKLFGGIEAGGTKFVCAVGAGPDELTAEIRFPTTNPEETIGKALDFFREQVQVNGGIESIGVACFGPLDPNKKSPTYGYITSTPKPGWANYDLVGHLQQVLNIPIGFDTDVNGAVLGEWRWGAGQGLDSLIYLTIGTGIGGGAMSNGQVIHGLLHTEMGHMRLPHDYADDPFPGVCPYHGDCWEGLACGPAIQKRWGQRAETLPPDHPAWAMEANYIACALMNLTLVLSPQKIILGGGVLEQASLFPMIRTRTIELLNGYIKSPEILSNIDQYIVPPGLGNRAGVLGAIALAQLASDSA